MQGSPEILSVKRSRAKPQADSKQGTAAPRKSRSKTVLRQTSLIATSAAAPDLTPMIATMAYFLAAERHFAPGHELDDWLEAERRVNMAAAT